MKIKKIHFIISNIVGKQKSQIKKYVLDCSIAEELFQCLDAHNSSIYPAIRRLLGKMKKLPSLPEDEKENENIRQIIHFLRVSKNNKIELPFDFSSVYSSLSHWNCKRFLKMKKENLDLNNIQKVLYEMQAVNVQMIDSLEKKVSDVKSLAKQKTSLVSPTHLKKKKMVMSNSAG